jgi:hypothetical protein
MGFFGGGGSAASNMVGATSSTAGTAGLVPAPAAGNNTRLLSSDATFREPAILPQYKESSRTLAVMGTSNASSSPSARVRGFRLAYMPADGDIDELLIRTGSSNPTASVNFYLAIWAMGEDGLPSTHLGGVIVACGLTATTTIVGTLSPVVSVKRGYYWLSANSESNTSANSINVGGVSTDQNLSSIVYGYSSDNFATQPGSVPSYTATTYNQTTHETFVLGTTSVQVGFRYQ